MKKYVYKLKGLLCISVIFSVINAVINAAMLLFPGLLIDNYKKGLPYIQKMLLIYALVFIGYMINAYFSNRAADYRRILFEKAIKKDFFKSAIEQNYKSFHSRDVGEYISLQTNDIAEMCMNYMNPLFFILDSMVMIIIFGIALIKFVNVYVTLAVIVFSVLIVFIPSLTGKSVSKRNKTYMDKLGRYTSTVKTLYESHEILDKAGKDKINSYHEKELDDVMDDFMKYRRLNSLAMVLNGGSVEALSLIVFAMVAFLLSKGMITLGMATIAFTYSTKFKDPMYELNTIIGTVISVSDIKKKLLLIIDGCEKDVASDEIISSIKTTELTKEYNEVKIHIPAANIAGSSKYLIRGENGAGKSVFFRLLMNFEKSSSGDIFYNDKADPNGIDASMCYSPQKPMIFDASYEENISIYGTYSLKNLDTYEKYFPEDIINHIKQNSDLKNLSGGEKQVIAMLRVLCSEKPILLLDEPFAAMNQVTIDCFMRHMGEMDRTVLIIAHNIDDYADTFDENIWIKRKGTN